jgi:hypothetical protein
VLLYIWVQLRVRFEYLLMAPVVIREMTRLLLVWGDSALVEKRIAEFTARKLLERWIPVQVACAIKSVREQKPLSPMREAWFYMVGKQVIYELMLAGWDPLRAHTLIDRIVREEALKQEPTAEMRAAWVRDDGSEGLPWEKDD